MFFHNFKYALITLLKDKMLIFWTLAFPLILGTFFSMAFSDIESSEKADIINIAVVATDTQNDAFKEAILKLSEEDSEQQLFNSRFVDEKAAAKLLAEDEIVGYIRLNEEVNVVVKQSGISETILQYVVDQILQTSHMIEDVAGSKLETYMQKAYASGTAVNQKQVIGQIYDEAMTMLNSDEEWLQDVSSPNMSYTMIEFYTLIAMTCMYGGVLGMVAINRNLANMSNNGKRIAVSPCSKSKLIISSALAAYIVQAAGVALLFLYTIYALNVDYGAHLLHVVLLALVGCFTGLSMGILAAAVLKKSEDTKVGILIAVTMLGCFLSGMMGITMKYLIDKNIPLVNQLNPVNMITDGLYSLYYYNTFDRYYANLMSLCLFASFMLGISVYHLRRQKYDYL